MFIPTPKNTRTITDLRERAIQTIKQVNKEGLVYVLYKSKPKAVIIDLEEFVSMQERLEDYKDYLDAKEVLKKPRGKLTSIEDVMKMYGVE